MNPRLGWRSVFCLPLAAAILLGALHGAAQSTFVVPGGLANTEGNSSMSDAFTAPSFRMQQVFSASEFAFLGSATCRIDSISFRIDGAATDSPSYAFGGANVRLSTTSASSDSLSPVFANNLGANALIVFSGPVTFGSPFFSGQDPQPFKRTITATTPFLYSPSMGNLLLDIQAGGGDVFGSGGMDAQSGVGDSISRVFALDEEALSGTADSLGLVTRFNITIIPEPAPILLTALGVAVFLFRRRARRQLNNS